VRVDGKGSLTGQLTKAKTESTGLLPSRRPGGMRLADAGTRKKIAGGTPAQQKIKFLDFQQLKLALGGSESVQMAQASKGGCSILVTTAPGQD